MRCLTDTWLPSASFESSVKSFKISNQQSIVVMESNQQYVVALVSTSLPVVSQLPVVSKEPSKLSAQKNLAQRSYVSAQLPLGSMESSLIPLVPFFTTESISAVVDSSLCLITDDGSVVNVCKSVNTLADFCGLLLYETKVSTSLAIIRQMINISIPIVFKDIDHFHACKFEIFQAAIMCEGKIYCYSECENLSAIQVYRERTNIPVDRSLRRPVYRSANEDKKILSSGIPLPMWQIRCVLTFFP